MSGPSDIGCERAHELLLELACAELEPGLAAEVRRHAAGCDRCGPELAQLTRVMDVAASLPLAEPSKGVEERILRAAREALAARAGSAEAREPIREAAAGYRSWFARLSEWALSPQVAMASVLLLMVGIGLYALPIGREPESVAFEAASDEREEREAPSPAAGATALPVAPSEAEQSESIRKENKAREAYAPAPGAERSAKSEAASGKRGDVAEPVRRSGAAAAREKSSSEARAPSKDKGGSVAEGSSARDQKMDGQLEGMGSAGGGLAKPKAPEPVKENLRKTRPQDDAFAEPPPASAPKKAPSSKAEGFAPPPAPAASQPARESADVPSAQNASAVAEKSSTTTDAAQRALKDGIAAAQRGAYAQAITLLQPLASTGPASLRPSASLWLARSLKGQGKCPEAVPYYATLTRSASASDDVLTEAADCYEKAGDPAKATVLRSRLRTQD